MIKLMKIRGYRDGEKEEGRREKGKREYEERDCSYYFS